MLARAFATSPAVRHARHLAAAFRETRNPLWRLLDALRRPGHRLALSEALHASAVSPAEYAHWKPRLHPPTLEAPPLADAPAWVLLYLIAHAVRTVHHAHGPMLDLVYAHLDDAAPDPIHGPLILLAATQLARFGLVVPLRRLAKTFLTVWIDDPAAYFNLMLQVISSIPNHTVESANIAVLLLKAMESRQLKLTSDTYQMLLNDRFVTLQLTTYLQSRMVREGFVPPASHLEAYLRFFAKDGAIHDAKKYYNAIHTHSPPIDDSTFFLNPSSIPQLRANTLMLGTHHSVPSAFGFLRKLAALQPHPTVVLPHAKHNVRTLHRLFRTKFRSIYDFTSTLTVLVRDSRCNSTHLIKLFRKAPGGRPTVAAYTVLIRGLLQKGDTVNAASYWKKLLQSGIAIDSEALAAGVAAITRIGRPYDAFLLLERFASHPNPDNPPTPPIGRFKKVALRKPVQVTQEVINDFMVALNRIHRPDIVFRLWDYMETLYGVPPNAFSLSILLQSARMAHRLDDTLSGALAHLSLKNPFRRPTSSPTPTPSRDEAVSTITSLLYDSHKNKLKTYGSGIWHDLEPLIAARKVFIQVLFGVAGEGDDGGEERVREMLRLESPATAARTSVDDDPAAGLGFGFGKLRGVKYVFEPFEDLFKDGSASSRRSRYPSVFPTNANCLQYILVLVLANRVYEVPLLLRWMRFLGIQPSMSTLAVGLAVWKDVSCQAPLIESMHRVGGGDGDDGDGGEESGGGKENGKGEGEESGEGNGETYENEGREYVRLVKWIKGWVGEKRVPSEKDVGKWMRIVKEVREVREVRR